MFSFCLNEYFVSTNSVMPSPLLISLSLNCNLSSWKTPLFVENALFDTVEVLAELHWLLRITNLSPDSSL